MPRRNRSNRRGKHNDDVSSTWVASNSNESDCESTTATIGSSDNSAPPSCTKFELVEKHSNCEENLEKNNLEKDNSKEHIESRKKLHPQLRQLKTKKALSKSGTRLNNLIDSILVAALLLTLGLSVGHFVGLSKCPKHIKINKISPTLVTKCMKHAMNLYRNLINENRMLKQHVHSLEKLLNTKTDETLFQKNKSKNYTLTDFQENQLNHLVNSNGIDEYERIKENVFNEIIGKEFFDKDPKQGNVEMTVKNSVKYHKDDSDKKIDELDKENTDVPQKCEENICDDPKTEPELVPNENATAIDSGDNGFILIGPNIPSSASTPMGKKSHNKSNNIKNLIKMFEEKDDVQVTKPGDIKKPSDYTVIKENKNDEEISFDTVINGKTYATDKYYDNTKMDKQTRREKRRSAERKFRSKKGKHYTAEHKVNQ